MKTRITIAILLAAICGTSNAAGVFDGNSDLSVTVSSTAVEYPVVLACLYKADNATHRGTLLAISDNGAGGSLDCLALEIRGDAAGDRINAVSTAAGSSSAAVTTVDSVAIGDYRLAVALFESASSRRIMDSFSVDSGRNWREETTTRNAGNWTHLSIGALYNSGGTNRYTGKIARAFVWFGADAAAMIANPNNFKGSRLYHSNRGSLIYDAIRPQLYLSQELTRKPGDYRDWGPEMTNNGVTFDYEYRR